MVWEPNEQGKYYIHGGFKEFFWGPFNDVGEIVKFIKYLNKNEEFWDYDGWAIVKGANPLPLDYADLEYIETNKVQEMVKANGNS